MAAYILFPMIIKFNISTKFLIAVARMAGLLAKIISFYFLLSDKLVITIELKILVIYLNFDMCF